MLPANPFFFSRLLAVFKASYVSDGRLEGFGGRSFMRSTHRGAAIGGGTHRPRALRGRAKRQQRASRASLRGAALTARARQRSEAGRASASISSNHALFTLSPPGHGLAAGGSNAGPQDSVRRPRAKHITAAAAARSIDRRGGPRQLVSRRRRCALPHAHARTHTGSARRSSGR